MRVFNLKTSVFATFTRNCKSYKISIEINTFFVYNVSIVVQSTKLWKAKGLPRKEIINYVHS